MQAENGVQIQNIYDEGTVLHRYICMFVYSVFYMYICIFILHSCICNYSCPVQVYIIFTMMANHPGALWRTPLPTRPPTPPATLSRSWEPALAATARWSEILFISINHDVMIFQIMISTSVMVRADVHRNHKDIDK